MIEEESIKYSCVAGSRLTSDEQVPTFVHLCTRLTHNGIISNVIKVSINKTNLMKLRLYTSMTSKDAYIDVVTKEYHSSNEKFKSVRL